MIYLIQTSVSLILLYMLYYFVLSDLPYFRYNRAYLLGSMIVSLTIPFLAGQLVLPVSVAPVISWNPVQEGWVSYEFEGTQNALSLTIVLTLIVKYIYLAGVSVVLTRLIKGLSRIYQYHIKGTKIHINGHRVVMTDTVHLPFSFLQTIYISRHIPIKKHVQTILEHEKVHITQWHTLDILFTELIHSVFWFNPVLLYYKKSLQEVHEYLADEYVCQTTNITEYAALLSAHNHISNMETALAHQFFQSQIKKRIMKMQEMPINKSAVWKFGFALPLIILILYAFATPDKDLSHKTLLIHSDTIPPASAIHKNKLPSNVKGFQRDNDQITILKDDGSTEVYDISNEKDKKAFSESYGTVPTAPAPPPPPKPGVPDVPPRVGVPSPPSAPTVPDAPMRKAPTPPQPPAPRDLQYEAFLSTAEQMPRFPGCENLSELEKDRCSTTKLLEYISSHLRYPEEAKNASIEGICVVQFIVTKSGDITNIKVVRDIGMGCGTEVERVIKSMNSMTEKWLPGKHDGKTVDVQMTIPVKFKLS